jgi:DNA ligase-1
MIRFGFHIKHMTEDLLTVEIIPKTFPTVQAALEYMSLDMRDKLQKGFREVDGSLVTSTMNLGQERKRKKEPPKSILELTDEVQRSVKRELINPGDGVDLGEPSDQPIKVLLAELWTESVNPKGWMISEKLDGMRMIWTGE